MQMTVTRVSLTNRVLILLATGFEESSVVFCVSQIREAGLPISLVGLSAGILKGLHGLAIRPDYSLEQLPQGGGYAGLIIPGTPQCVAALLADPRVHQLVQKTLEEQGFLAAMTTAVAPLLQSNLICSKDDVRFIPQGDLPTEQFISQLIDIISQ